GATLNRNRLEIAYEITDELVRTQRATGTPAGLSREALLEYTQHDLSKLFISIVSHRPELFRKYVEWQRSLFVHRNIPSATILDQLIVTRSVLTRHLSPAEMGSVQEILTIAEAVLEGIMQPEEPYIRPAAPCADLAAEYLSLLIERRGDEAVALVCGAVDAGLDTTAAYLDIIEPVQREVGRLWQINELSVGGEHYATETSRILMAALRSRFSPRSLRDTAVVTACLGGELHELGARMVSDFLYLGGYRSIFVGGNTPHDTILTEIERSGAAVLALSATMTLQVRNAYELIDRLRHQFGRNVQVLVGGYAFNQAPSLVDDIGADLYADRADHAVEIIGREVTSNAR
ncbi:MAG: cobalamin B12-binding domain-containing protein, partial [Alkalispirochaeta sp.]